MINNLKEIIKDLIYSISIFILTIFLLFLIFINSSLSVEYFKYMDSVVIHFKDCHYWKINQIPQNLTNSQKWKIVTTIGECKIKDKKYFLEENINNNNEYTFSVVSPNFSLKYDYRSIGQQAKNYLQEFNEK